MQVRQKKKAGNYKNHNQYKQCSDIYYIKHRLFTKKIKGFLKKKNIFKTFMLTCILHVKNGRTFILKLYKNQNQYKRTVSLK